MVDEWQSGSHNSSILMLVPQPSSLSGAPCSFAAARLMELTLCFGLLCLPEVTAPGKRCRDSGGQAQGYAAVWT